MSSMTRMKEAMAAALLMAGLAVAPAHAQPEQLHLSLNYGGHLFLKVLDVDVEQTLDSKTFQSSAHIKTSGLLSLFHKVNLTAETQGRIEHDGPQPKSFTYRNADGHKNRRVTALWTGGDVATQSHPQFPNMGDPAASREQRVEAADPLTVLTRMTIAPAEERPCDGVRHFYDGKQRYDVAFAYRGSVAPDARERRLGLTGTMRCSLSYREIAGFRKKPPEQRTQGLKQDVSLVLGRFGSDGPWVVSSLRADTMLGAAHIDLENLSASGPVNLLARRSSGGASIARR